MSSELAAQLSRLYLDYYAGRLEFNDYRHRRSLLLNSLTIVNEDEQESLVTQPRPAQESPQLSAEHQLAKAAQRPDRRIFSVVNVLAVCAVVVIAVIVVVMRQIDSSEPEPIVSAPALEALPMQDAIPADSEVVRTTPDAGQELVEDFVARQDWRQMSLQEFTDSWGRILAADRIVAKGKIWFEPMADSLQAQIDEVQALAVDPQNDEELDQLYGFALHLGLVELAPAGWSPKDIRAEKMVFDVAPADVSTAADRDTPVPESDQTVLDSSDEVEQQPVSASETATESDDANISAVVDAIAHEDRELATEAFVDDAVISLPVREGNCSIELLKTRKRTCYDMISDDRKGPILRVLPGGAFMMGSTGEGDESPLIEAEVPQAFAISTYEVSRSDYEIYCQQSGRVCPDNPWLINDMPVVNVSWEDAVDYCAWLSRATGQRYRLPTGKEWEYAARAGSQAIFPFGDRLLPGQARFSAIAALESPLPMSDQTTQRNAFGLWHVVGNVQEWVADRDNSDYSQRNGEKDTAAPASEELRIVRGGSYADDAHALRSSARRFLSVDARSQTTGFRVVREL